ncbi:hypothetical protein KR009_006252 [Drosophila setifemur]|nr:hypothetical protein KR009_006252 [Drosophila setifemur]
METQVDFGKISSRLYGNYAQLAKNLKEQCVSKTVMKPPAFFLSLQRMMEEEEKTTSPSKDMDVVDCADLFRTLDEYPQNLQKIHHPTKKRELQRANSMFLKSADATADQSTALNTSNVSLSMSRLEEQRSAVELYGEFKVFQRKLAKIYNEAAALDTAEGIYKDKLAQIHGFAQQLEKLLPTGSHSHLPDAFTPDDESKLLAIAENMEQLNYLRSHRLQLPNPAEILASGSVAARLEMLVEVLTYALMEISSCNLI